MNTNADNNEVHYRCADIYALDVIGGRWRLAVIWTLSSKESMRYNELKRHLKGITNIMLTRSLRSLEEHRLVTRTEFARTPPHVEYALTPKCKEVLPALEILHRWGKSLLIAER
ncbi:helix-turn-helix transcriptional regulator, partial [Desulfovibrio sp. OttesenSCG-928-F07]|nr:helix-turn-helix transcriptional regulator [Desulfovibrio sp. OttesenSCG-928-F07]